MLIKKLVKKQVLILLSITIVSCSSVTIRPNGGDKDSSSPSYIDSKPFYLWGLVGRHQVDVNEVCGGNDVLQMQTIESVSDFLIGAMTLFVYSPRTVKVWCANDNER